MGKDYPSNFQGAETAHEQNNECKFDAGYPVNHSEC